MHILWNVDRDRFF